MTLATTNMRIGILLLLVFETSLVFSLPKDYGLNDVLNEAVYTPSPNQDYNEVLQFNSIDLSAFGTYSTAAVASDSIVCSDIGRDILANGGSAVDSAIAIQLCDGVVNAHSMGIGGGLFMTIYDRSSNTKITIDARESAPAAASHIMFLNNSTLSKRGGLAVAVPGEISGYWEAHQLYGILPWRELFEPSIKLCKKGFKVEKALAETIKKYELEISTEPTMRNIFRDMKTKTFYKQGDIMKRPTLAKTLQRIADYGIYEFYYGETAKNLIKDIREMGGIMTLKDLHHYKAVIREPIKIRIKKGGTLYSVPPPSGGLVLAFLLNILEGYHITPLDISTNGRETLLYHRIAEAMKFAYAKRTELGDNLLNLKEHIYNLTSKEYAAETRKKINDKYTFKVAHYGALSFIPDDAGTAHTSVIDSTGSAVSLTSSINLHFGAFRVSSSTGIILNNQMDDFSTPSMSNYFGMPPSPTNFIRSGKRPMSSMSPAILIDDFGDVKMVIGASGGSKIISSIAQVLIRHLWLTEELNDAVDTPRLHHQLIPNLLQYEEEFNTKLIENLEYIGHKMKSYPRSQSVVQAITRNSNGELEAVADGRKGGKTAGF